MRLLGMLRARPAKSPRSATFPACQPHFDTTQSPTQPPRSHSRHAALRPTDFSHWLRNEKSLVCCRPKAVSDNHRRYREPACRAVILMPAATFSGRSIPTEVEFATRGADLEHWSIDPVACQFGLSLHGAVHFARRATLSERAGIARLYLLPVDVVAGSTPLELRSRSLQPSQLTNRLDLA